MAREKVGALVGKSGRTSGTRPLRAIIVTTPQGMSCPIAAGEGWRNVEPIVLDPMV
jgi:hypothetical protein